MPITDSCLPSEFSDSELREALTFWQQAKKSGKELTFYDFMLHFHCQKAHAVVLRNAAKFADNVLSKEKEKQK